MIYGTPTIVTNGLVLNLDAANTKSYVSGSTNWFSLGNPSLSGSLFSGPTFNNNNGGSIVFDGIDDYAVTSTVTNFRSICMWINKPFVDFGAFPWKYLLDARPGFSNGYFANNNPGSWSNWYLNGNSIPSSWALLPNDQWFHLYLQADANYTSTINFMSRVSNNENLGGRISNIQIYNRNLSASEITQNYNSLKSRFGLS